MVLLFFRHFISTSKYQSFPARHKTAHWCGGIGLFKGERHWAKDVTYSRLDLSSARQPRQLACLPLPWVVVVVVSC